MMTLKEFLNSDTGTYISALPDELTAKSIYKWAKEYGIPNLIDWTKFHTTVVYSRKPFDPGYTEKDLILVGNITDFDIFKNSDGTNALVLKINCPGLNVLHKHYVDEYEATHDFDDYTPHITLSYDVPDNFRINNLPIFRSIGYNTIKVEPLDLNWKDKL